MKNIIKVSFAAVLILTGISCEKAVDKNPTHAATLENAFVSLNDFETSKEYYKTIEKNYC